MRTIRQMVEARVFGNKPHRLSREALLELAVRVALTDTRTRAWLDDNDPMLVRQMTEALNSNGGN